MRVKLSRFVCFTLPDRIMIIVWGVSLAIFLWASLSQYASLKTQMHDLGNVAQPLWNTINGRFMEMTNFGNLGIDRMNRFGGHLNFVYLLILPVYVVWTDPRLLLVIQVLVGVSTVTPLYLLGRQLLGKESLLSLVVPLLYLLNPMVQDALLYDIHAIVLGTFFLGWSVYFLTQKRWRWFTVSAVLLALCKEDMPLILVMLGVYQAFVGRQFRQGLLISSLSGIYFLVGMLVLKPYFAAGVTDVTVGTRYSALGNNVVEIGLALFRQPGVVLETLQANQIGRYFFYSLLGFGVMPILSGIALLSVPSYAISLLSGNQIMSMPFGYYYLAPVMTIFSIATVYALQLCQSKEWGKMKVYPVGVALIIWAVIYSWWFSPLPYGRTGLLSDFIVTPHHRLFNQVAQHIPSQASLSVQNNLGAKLSHRVEIRTFPYGIDQSDYVVIDLTEPYSQIRDWPRQRNFIHLTQTFPQEYYDAVLSLFEDEAWKVVYAQDGYFIFARGQNGLDNQDTFVMFEKRARMVFEPYQPYVPVEYKKLQFDQVKEDV